MANKNGFPMKNRCIGPRSTAVSPRQKTGSVEPIPGWPGRACATHLRGAGSVDKFVENCRKLVWNNGQSVARKLRKRPALSFYPFKIK
jgi:hypothetical protein